MAMRLVCALLLVGLVLVPGSLLAQQTSTASAAGDDKKSIGFRLADWKTAHFSTAEQASQAEQTLRQIGCEVEKFDHDGHVDLKYRCVTWKRITVNSDEQIAQWNSWLDKHGLQTMIVDPDSGVSCSRVGYQLADSRRVGVGSNQEANSTRQILELMGCQVTVHDNDGRIELEYSCPEWKTVGFPNCGIAHSWQDWMKQMGFATRHSH